MPVIRCTSLVTTTTINDKHVQTSPHDPFSAKATLAAAVIRSQTAIHYDTGSRVAQATTRIHKRHPERAAKETTEAAAQLERQHRTQSMTWVRAGA